MPVFALFWNVAPKSTVYSLSQFAFFGSQFFYQCNFFVDSLSKHIIVHTCSIPKKCLFSRCFEKLLEELRSICCLDLLLCLFLINFARFFLRARCTLLAENTAWFGNFFKVSPFAFLDPNFLVDLSFLENLFFKK